MEIKTLTYSKSYEMITPFGLKYWEKIGMEAEIDSKKDNPQDCLKILKDEVETFHQENNKEGDKPYEEPSIQIEKPSVKLDPDTKVIEQYREAVTNGNETKVKLIENIYNNEKLKDAIKE